jgi:uncharacterized protein YjiS (DUF1127 family)
MADAVGRPIAFVSRAGLRSSRFAALLGRVLCEVILARARRRALNDLSDDLLKDIGATRSDIDFLAAGLVCRRGASGRDSLGLCCPRAARARPASAQRP